MAKEESLRNLAEILAKLYPDPKDMLRIMSEAGMDMGSPLAQRIALQAKNQEKTEQDRDNG